MILVHNMCHHTNVDQVEDVIEHVHVLSLRHTASLLYTRAVITHTMIEIAAMLSMCICLVHITQHHMSMSHGRAEVRPAACQLQQRPIGFGV